MKKLGLAIMTVAAIAMMSGCASIQTASKKDLNGEKLTTAGAEDVMHINGSNWGFYVLSVPIFTGSTEKPGDMLFGTDTVKLANVVNMVTKKSKDLGATKTVDMNSGISSTWIFPVFFIRDVQVSANGVK